MPSEEQTMINIENEEGSSLITAYSQIPYAMLSEEIDSSSNDLLTELTEICKYYKVYKKGANFVVEGTNGDYVPAKLKFKTSASLINKEARFLFAEPPDIVVKAKADVGAVSQEARDNITVLNDLVHTILTKNKFEESLIKAAKDCFIGKRVAGVVNFNETDGVTVTFLNSKQFVYEFKSGNTNVLKKFVGFEVLRDSVASIDKRIFKKKFVLEEDGYVYVEETLYDGAGTELEVITEYQPTKLKEIPAVIIINDGLLGELRGESEIDQLDDYESWYSRLSNADIDAERKNMNAIRYAVDMEANSTKNLSSSPGSFWDLQSDQNLDDRHPTVGTLESSMNYSESLDKTLQRIKNQGYEQVDMPNINLETMSGTITSGKALKAIYWPLIVRCGEKMKVWGPQLNALVDIIIKGALVYPNCVTKYSKDTPMPVDYEIEIVQNTPLPEDEEEEKNIDLSEVDSFVMSKKAYMKKWRGLSDDEADEELKQMALERQILEDSTFSGSTTSESIEEELPYPNAVE